jgi:DNA mismatch endonuclease (patch repair protein)
MRNVRSSNTAPERYVRSLLHKAGFRFVLGGRALPGKPDLVLPRYRLVVWVHGCFWHSHSCKKGRTRPKANAEFWSDKLDENVRRDAANYEAVLASGWETRILWECTLREDSRDLVSELSNRRAKRE